MEGLQVLVATMHRSDFSIVGKMNIRCNAVIANQAEREEIATAATEYGVCKMITTKTRGVGLNRNIALMASEGEYLLFADDDVVYNDDMPEAVMNAFRQLPEADVILFGMDITKKGNVIEKRRGKNQRLHVWNAFRYGTYCLAVRRKAVLQHNITFHQSFGGGCMFSAGEDSLFIKSCFDSGLKVFSHEYALGTCAKDSSTWFEGFNEKFFYDKGVLARFLFPRMFLPLVLYYMVRFQGRTEISAFRRLSLMLDGIRGAKSLSPYSAEK